MRSYIFFLTLFFITLISCEDQPVISSTKEIIEEGNVGTYYLTDSSLNSFHYLDTTFSNIVFTNIHGEEFLFQVIESNHDTVDTYTLKPDDIDTNITHKYFYTKNFIFARLYSQALNMELNVLMEPVLDWQDPTNGELTDHIRISLTNFNTNEYKDLLQVPIHLRNYSSTYLHPPIISDTLAIGNYVYEEVFWSELFFKPTASWAGMIAYWTNKEGVVAFRNEDESILFTFDRFE